MNFVTRRSIPIALLVLLAAACGYWGGGGNSIDVALVRSAVGLRAASEWPTTLGIILNTVGGAVVTIGLALGAAIWLGVRGRARDGFALAAIVLGGRLLIDLIKLLLARSRPSFDLHPVTTHSLSFPSAHAGNSMVAFCALVLVLAPSRHRLPAVIAAVGASLAVGASRPLLGVHWPSDVVGGWAAGAAWILLWLPYLKSGSQEAEHDIVGGHRTATIEP